MHFKSKFQDITDTTLGHKPMKTDIIPVHKKLRKDDQIYKILHRDLYSVQTNQLEARLDEGALGG